MDTPDGRGAAAIRPVNGTEFAGSEPHANATASNENIVRPALTKEELQNLLFESLGLSKRECREMVNAIFEEMRAAI